MEFFKRGFIFVLLFLFSVSFVSSTMELETPEASSFSEVQSAEPGADGSVGFNIPLGSVKGRGGMDLPVNLNYASGIQLEQEASWVGLGFGLGFGAISRVPVGVPDDSPGGFLNGNTKDFNDQDYYSVSFPGGGGKLIFDDSRTPYFADWSASKIDFTKDASGKIISWEITTTDGTRYVFDLISTTSSTTSSWTLYGYKDGYGIAHVGGADETDNSLSTPYAATWYLTKILSSDYKDDDSVAGPSNQDSGNWVEIQYSDEGNYRFNYPNTRATSCQDDINCGTFFEPYTVNSAFSWVGNHEATGGDERLLLGSIKRANTMKMLYPSKVITPLTYAEFDYDTTSRMDGRDYNDNKKLARLNNIFFYPSNGATTPVQTVKFIYANNSDELVKGGACGPGDIMDVAVDVGQEVMNDNYHPGDDLPPPGDTGGGDTPPGDTGGDTGGGDPPGSH